MIITKEELKVHINNVLNNFEMLDLSPIEQAAILGAAFGVVVDSLLRSSEDKNYSIVCAVTILAQMKLQIENQAKPLLALIEREIGQ